MRHLQGPCRALTSPVELLGGIALLPLPASLANGWPPKAPTLQNAQLSAARQSWADHLRSRGVLIGGLALLFLGGGAGGVVILHGSQRPASVIAPRHQATPARSLSTTSPTSGSFFDSFIEPAHGDAGRHDVDHVWLLVG
jgi:hypothetical protein